jgi:hypothetical protein
MSDMKKLLSILSESTTTSASIANGTPGAKGPIKRPSDTIFAEDNTEPVSPETPNSPSNFGLWKNSAVISREQTSLKKVPVDKTKMYPQIVESYKQQGQSDIDDLASSRRNAERNAGLNEPDEFVPNYGNNTEREFGTWYFTYQDGSIVIKDGKALLASSSQGVREVISIAKKHGIDVRSHEGAPPKLSESGYKTPKSMDDWSEEEWDQWDDMVSRVGQRADAQREREAANRKPESNGEHGVSEGNDKNKSVPSSTPRNFVAKNAKTSGAGAHKDEKRSAKQGNFKHKSQRYEFAETEMSEATGDSKFDSMMGDITSPEALDTREALALIRDLVYGGGASYEEALHQASVSFGINRAKLHALYKKQGMMEGTDDKEPFDYAKWKASTVKPRKPRGYKDAEALGKAIDSEQSELRKRKEQGVAEGFGGRVDSPVSQAITRRIINQYPGLLKYGPEKVMAAIDEVSEWHKVGPDDEIGSSDVSAWVKEVARYLQTGAGEGLAEDTSDRVGFHLDSERAYQAVMSKFGDQVDQDESSGIMYVPRNLWGRLEQVAFDADGIGAIEDGGEENPEHYGRELSEEVIADRLKNELDLFKKGTKAKDKAISKKPASKEIQKKKPE